MFKKIITKIFGTQLPCGHGRRKGKLGRLYTCNVCGRAYRLMGITHQK